jgi:peptidoglycan/LPS O-acetylase OafA/YrhL
MAITLVLWNHLVGPLLPPGWLAAVTQQAWVGVDLFFALSGFLIGGILIDRRDSPRLMEVFYLRRGARILPLYFLALAVVMIAVLDGMPGSYHNSPLWVYPFFLTNLAYAFSGMWDWRPLAVFWSLAVEEQFYLAAPWIVRACQPERLGWLAVGIVGCAEVLRIGAQLVSPGTHLFIHVLTPFHMDALGFGILVAWMVRNPRSDRTISFIVAHWRLVALAGMVLLLGLDWLRSGPGAMQMSLWGYPVVGAGCGLLVLVAVRGGPSSFARILALPLLGRLGRRSYFIYLFHHFGWYALAALLGLAVEAHWWAAACTSAATVALTWIAAECSWRWIEEPIIAWGHRKKY